MACASPERRDRQQQRAHQREHGSRHDRARRRQPAGEAREVNAWGAWQRAARLLQGSGRRPPSSRSTASATRSVTGLTEEDGTMTLWAAFAVHQLRWREDLSRGSRSGAGRTLKMTCWWSAWTTNVGARRWPHVARERARPSSTIHRALRTHRTRCRGAISSTIPHTVGQARLPARTQDRNGCDGGHDMKNRLAEMFGIEFPIFAFSHCRTLSPPSRTPAAWVARRWRVPPDQLGSS